MTFLQYISYYYAKKSFKIKYLYINRKCLKKRKKRHRGIFERKIAKVEFQVNWRLNSVIFGVEFER